MAPAYRRVAVVRSSPGGTVQGARLPSQLPGGMRCKLVTLHDSVGQPRPPAMAENSLPLHRMSAAEERGHGC